MSRQETSNTFSEGLIKDLNPINTPNTALTDCVNGTIITYDGNEHSLQNDRGNYALQNCKLPKGYIPVGTTEHGGILYIVSYDPINKDVEIGSYPSTRVVTDPIKPTDTIVSDSNIISGKYSKLSANCKLNIFSGNDPKEYKLYPGDGYKLSGKTSSEVSRDEFFIVDENKALHDITDEVKISNDFTKVSWGVPGWMAVKTHIANIDSFGIGVKSISVPTYLQDNSKMTIKFRFRIIATDSLITDSNSGLSIKYEITDGITRYIETKPITNWYSLGNGGKAYYLDTNNLEFNVNENTVITVNATPYFKGIEYDNCSTVFTYKVSGIKDIDGFKIGGETWKYKTLDDRILIDFSTEGLEGYHNISDLELRYSIYALDGSEIILNKPVTDWQFAGMYTMLEIPFNGSFVGENMYIIKFDLVSAISSEIEEDSETDPIFSTSKLLIATKLLNEKYKNVTNFDNLEFGDWITEYKKYVINPKINIEENEIGKATPINIPDNIEDFKPILSQTEPYDYWKSGQESKNFNTLLTKSAYKKVTSASEISLESSYQYNKSFKISSDAKLLSGPLWNDALQNCKVKVQCNNNQPIELKVKNDGTITPTNLIIPGSCSIKSIYKPNILTSDGVTVWSYELEDMLNGTEGYVKCDLTTVKKQEHNTVGVKISTSSKSASGEAMNSNPYLTLTVLPPLVNQLKTHDVMFLESIIACSAPKTSAFYGALLGYEGIYNIPTNIVNSEKDRSQKSIYFMALPASSSYDKMQVIQIGDSSYDKNSAKEIFNNTLKKFNKLTCYDDAVTGGFIKLSKFDTTSKSVTEITYNGTFILDSAKYLELNILNESGRNQLINNIKSRFASWNINCNLLTSTENWTQLASIEISPIKKSFEINDNAELLEKLKISLEESDNLINERNSLIENQWNLTRDRIYTEYYPNMVTYFKKEDTILDLNTSLILELLNNKKPSTDNKAIYKITYWNTGLKEEDNNNNDREFAFAYCDPESYLM